MDERTEADDLRAALTSTERERDLYRKLLDLTATSDVEQFLQQALDLVVELAEARRGYIELRAEGDPTPFWVAHGVYDRQIDEIREAISSGIIAEAIATGRTIALESALSHPQYRGRGSVQRGRIEAVLCAPIGTDPPLGVIYLQNRIPKGPFSDDDRARVELFARICGAIADRLLLLRRGIPSADHTRELRTKLRADGILGESAAVAEILDQIATIAPLDVCVLLTGDTGTGKTQFARAIHDNSPRRKRDFVAINCAALNENLVESELFGALPGAHSQASKKIDGKVAAAEGGTLFLDEIGELYPPVQAKLLQFLQSHEYYPLGGNKPVRADVRVIAATNVNLEEAVAAKEFRKDLFYRLQVMSFRLPSLAERRSDIPLLAHHFCEKAILAHKLPRLALSPSAVRAAETAEWPGNLRQLENVMTAAAIRAASERAQQIEVRHLFGQNGSLPAGPAGATSQSPPSRLTFQEATRQFQRDLVKKTLEETKWNITEGAALLDITRSHLYNLIRAFGLGRP